MATAPLCEYYRGCGLAAIYRAWVEGLSKKQRLLCASHAHIWVFANADARPGRVVKVALV